MVEEDKMTKTFRRGDRVRDCYGRAHIVLRQEGTTVYTYTCLTWLHVNKCWKA
jgi:hypothetical protein